MLYYTLKKKFNKLKRPLFEIIDKQRGKFGSKEKVIQEEKYIWCM